MVARELVVQLAQNSPKAGLPLDERHFAATLRQIQRGADAADSTSDHQDRANTAIHAQYLSDFAV
jgi:hypothetical protein